MANIATLAFEQTPIELVHYRGLRWVRGTDIARALGYRHPRASMAKLYARSAEEFTDEMTVVVTGLDPAVGLTAGELVPAPARDATHPQSEGGGSRNGDPPVSKLETGLHQNWPESGRPIPKLDMGVASTGTEVRLFSARGAHLFAMLARTERAAQFRRWVLDVLEGACAVDDEEPLSAMQEFRLIRYSVYLMDRMGAAPSMERCEELFLRLMRVNRRLGMTTAAFSVLMNPALRQQPLPLEGGGPAGPAAPSH